MKRFYFFIIAIIFASLLVVSCTDNTYNMVKENISEIRETVLIYNDEDIYVSFMSGIREKNFVSDGVSTESIYFGVLTLKIKNSEEKIENVEYQTNINSIEYTGEMLLNPYDKSFVVDLCVDATVVDSIDVSFAYNNVQKVANLTNISNKWQINAYKALEIATNDFKDYLRQHIVDNKLQAESFVKVVYNDKYSSDYYWYVQFITQNGNEYTEIINPHTSEILAKNIK